MAQCFSSHWLAPNFQRRPFVFATSIFSPTGKLPNPKPAASITGKRYVVSEYTPLLYVMSKFNKNRCE